MPRELPESAATFLAMVSHDLRLPFNAIRLWLKLLRRNAPQSQAVAEALDNMEEAVKDGCRLIADLLTVSSSIQGKFTIEREPVDLIPLMSAAVDAMRSTAKAKQVTLEFRSAVPSFTVSGDGGRLKQVAWNLLSNAVKFSRSGQRVCLDVRPTPGGIEIRVIDAGIGIPAGFLPRVFDRFAQSTTPAQLAATGLGLGLSIVKDIVESHDGTVTAESAGEDRGATFTVRLPRLGANLPGSEVTHAPEADADCSPTPERRAARHHNIARQAHAHKHPTGDSKIDSRTDAEQDLAPIWI